MNENTLKAKALLEANDYTCVLCLDGHEYHSTERGVRALLGWIRQGVSLEGYYAADRVVGKAAAFLYVKMGIRGIYAKTISDAAAALLTQHHIPFQEETRVAAIMNRDQTGLCPMEAAVQDASSPEEAYEALCAAVQRMMAQRAKK